MPSSSPGNRPGRSLIRLHFFNYELTSISNNQSFDMLDMRYQNLTILFFLFYVFIGNFDFQRPKQGHFSIGFHIILLSSAQPSNVQSFFSAVTEVL